MENLTQTQPDGAVRAVLFDMDGTISTLRCGWEQTMQPLMLEMISGHKGPYDPALVEEVDRYIDESTGIQTIYQMKWLAAQAVARCPVPRTADPWWYKEEYNRRLMETVNTRIDDVASGRIPADSYLIRGAKAFLAALNARGVKTFIASGTDHPDVVHEATVLGVEKYFTRIAGAPVHAEGCSKEKVLKMLIEDEGLRGSDVAVIGDGKVEIALGVASGARTIGMATNERTGGLDPVKQARLIHAGAELIAADFTDTERIFHYLGL